MSKGARETVEKEAREMVAEEAKDMAKEAREMMETMLVLVAGSALTVKLIASLPGPHALDAEEQNLVPDMVAFPIVVREAKEAKAAKAAMSSRATGLEAFIEARVQELRLPIPHKFT